MRFGLATPYDLCCPHVSVGQCVLLIAGIAWLALVLARPGLIASGTGWIAPPGKRPWKNAWFWLLFGASALVLLGQIDALGYAVAPIGAAGYLLWAVVVGWDVTHLMRALRAGEGSLEALRAAIRTRPSDERRTLYLGFIASFLGFPAALLLLSAINVLAPESVGPTVQSYVNAIQVMFLWRCVFENCHAEGGAGLDFRWTAPGTILSFTLVAPMAVAIVSSHSTGSFEKAVASVPFVLVTIVLLAGWGAKDRPASG
ncbi:MAG: hypothetical protein FJZ01_12730 [Candidatus Sericytochromatia bacterium]|nr:hypothetical protein [Candidatus Tanganyikabacteria bacterium]